ncbi:putative ribosomal protein L36e [Aspergillus uvarum CBS 121591]|uniref:60S ribosomal protein L36 n=7 Tax=Aspergillus TaxID=5052 RepID=A0A319CFA7_9EURO|nr:putative ribosomal protein L36e [Aspergillus uvarum CBS 121591]PYH77223.1 putative ribosomal protein L36e [Aspergillus uvarum CBS 121591]
MYDYRRSLRSEDILTQTVCLTVSTCCLGMRLYSKISITRAPGYAAITFETDRHGNGIHQLAVAASDLREFSKLANASQVLYGPLIYITKLSILLLYLRLFAPSTRNTPFWLIQTLIWMNFLFYFADTIVKICECKPRSKIWDQDIPGQCININIPILVTSIVNVVSDFLMLLLPIVCVWRLQMTWWKKMGLSAVFAAGIFACICSVMRLVVSVRNRTTRDRTHDWFPEFLWTHSSQKAKAWVSSIGTGSASIQVKGPLAASNPAMRIIPQRLWKSGHDCTGTESTADNYWEMRDVGAYRGICYTTTEATANRSVPEGINVDVPNSRKQQHRRRQPQSITVVMAQERSGIVVGLNKGHKTTPLNTPKTRVSRTKGQSSRRTAFVREIAREVVGLAPYERRIIELLRNTQDKRARKLAKKRLGTFGRGKRKVEDMQRVIAEARRVGAH